MKKVISTLPNIEKTVRFNPQLVSELKFNSGSDSSLTSSDVSDESNDKPQNLAIESILDHIGHTPLIQLRRIPNSFKGKPNKVYIKCEHKNPSGSIKDRLAVEIIKWIEKSEPALLSSGCTLVTSGDPDLSISIGMICAVKKTYKCLAFIPSINQERKDALKCFGVKIAIIPEINGNNKNLLNLPQTYFNLAEEFCQSLPGESINLCKYYSQAQSIVANRIFKELQNELESPVLFVGEKDSIGLINSIGERLQSWNTKCSVVQVEMDTDYFKNQYKLNNESDTNKTIPITPNVTTVKVTEKEAYRMTRKLILEEGIWVGPRGGALLAGALKALEDLPEEELNYETEIVLCINESLNLAGKDFLSNEWMLGKGFYTQVDINKLKWWDGISLNNLRLKSAPTLEETCLIGDAVNLLEESGNPLAIILDMEALTGPQTIIGIITEDLIQAYKDGKFKKDVLVREINNKEDKNEREHYVIKKNFGRISCTGTIGELEKVLEENPFAVVYKEIHKLKEGGIVQDIHMPCGIATQIDVIKWVSGVMDHHREQSQWGIQTKTVFDE